MLVHTGTFDVENYGDLLFPTLVNRRLAPRSIKHVSPAGGPAQWKDTVPSIRLDEATGMPLAGILIGGGNIVHPMPSVLPHYKRKGVDLTGYADLWLVPALAADNGLPIVWNAPGVPNFFEDPFLPMVREALDRTNYISVRDAQSQAFLAELIPDRKIAVVPDPAWELPAAYPAVQLAGARAQCIAELGGNPSARYVVFHVNARYINDLGNDAVAKEIEGIANALSARPILVAIGPCHGDGVTAHTLASQLHTAPLVLEAPQRTFDIAALISGAVGYVGSSMHGFITAAAYGVPAIMIARGKPKFDGLVQLVGTPHILANTWDGICERFCNQNHETLVHRFGQVQRSASDSLDKHWSAIEAELTNYDGTGQIDQSHVDKARIRVLDAQSQHMQSRSSKGYERLRRITQSRLSCQSSETTDLKKTIKNLQHKIASLVLFKLASMKSLFSSRRREKFRRSARKRDYKP